MGDAINSYIQDSKKAQHFILTRFNLGIYTKNWDDKKLEDWYKRAFHLFESFSYQSISQQITGSFTWVVIFDHLTPAHLRDKIESYRTLTNFTPVYVNELEGKRRGIKAAIMPLIERDTEYVVTSNLDIDDMIQKFYIDLAHKRVRLSDKHFFTFNKGYLLSVRNNDVELWNVPQLNNQFSCFVDKPDFSKPYYGLSTIWAKPHGFLPHDKSVTKSVYSFTTNMPMWVWVLHNNNQTASTHNWKNDRPRGRNGEPWGLFEKSSIKELHARFGFLWPKDWPTKWREYN